MIFLRVSIQQPTKEIHSIQYRFVLNLASLLVVAFAMLAIRIDQLDSSTTCAKING
jgi:hypothetical protein